MYKRNSGWSRALQLGVACALVAGIVALFHQGQQKMRWRTAEGNIKGRRIAADHAIETKSGGQLAWKAEYKVDYSVDGHEYVVWTDSGIRGDSEADVQLRLPNASSSCRVLYNPEKPDVAVVSCP